MHSIRNHRRLLSRLLIAGALLPALLSAQPATPSATPASTDAERLEPVAVFGSRIARTEVEGPSPLAIYDEEYIRATGAFTLADLLRTLPQNYTGIAAGRGSTPNELNPEFGQRTETTLPAFNFVLGASAAPPGQTGVSGAGLRGLGSGSTLVLVDGRRLPKSAFGNRSSDSRQGFVDLNSIPLGMIERIEVVTDGASAIYGADAIAGVINIVLKKDYIGSELSGNYRGTFDGGARERSTLLTTGFAREGLRGTFSFEYFDRSSLKASQRSFSANQDHRDIQIGIDGDGNPVFGSDLRLNWGYPATVQARVGDLNGVLDPNGNPTRVALAPEGTDGTNLTPADFIGVAQAFPSGARRGNTAEFLDLIPESERWATQLNLTAEASELVEVYTRIGYSDRRGRFSTQPGVSSAAAASFFGQFASIVPAEIDGQPNPDNPFGQDVLVGMFHYEFGSIHQDTINKSVHALVGARGRIGPSWEWDAGLNYGRGSSDELTRNFSGAAITAALTNPDPALRLNPFADARAGGVDQSEIYRAFEQFVLREGRSSLWTLDLHATGELFDIPGGPVQMAAGGEYNKQRNRSTVSTTPDEVVRGSEDTYALFTEFSVPIFGRDNAVELARRLDLSLAARYEDQDRAGSTTVPKVGVAWVPHESLLLRATYSRGFRAPDLTEYQVAGSSFTGTITDPRREPAQTSGVQLQRGSNEDIRPEKSTNEFYGLVFEPPVVPGLGIEVGYHRTEQRDSIRSLSANAFVANEDLFPGRVVRAAPTEDDIALGQPGAVTQVDLTLVNFGLVQSHSLDTVLRYTINTEELGRFRFTGAATRTLRSRIEVQPGQPLQEDEGDTFSPPKWSFVGSVLWNRDPWSASMFVNYIGSFESNRGGNWLAPQGFSSFTTVDLRGSYEFVEGVFGGHARGLRVGAGIGNIFNEKPPFSNTVFGFNGGLHSPLGRSYEISLTLPF
ncbi:MAG: TonB-dependent receptor [Puniceicoccaceae bacterium]|nr:MAG: TonB-dependent receptor [Puniceicoccaceae bacterium]